MSDKSKVTFKRAMKIFRESENYTENADLAIPVIDADNKKENESLIANYEPNVKSSQAGVRLKAHTW